VKTSKLAQPVELCTHCPQHSPMPSLLVYHGKLSVQHGCANMLQLCCTAQCCTPFWQTWDASDEH